MTGPVRSDVLIVGGGVMGCAVAYFLTREPSFAGRVALVERDPAYRRASSALSASSIRQQFTTPVSIAMSRYGWEFLQTAERALDCQLGTVERGYLILCGVAASAELARRVAVQRGCGADVELLDPPTLAARFPWLNGEGIGAASYGASGEGWFDGTALHQGLRRAAVAAGVELVRGEVVALTPRGGRIAHARLADGRRVVARTYVNAAGPWAADVMPAGLPALPVVPRRRQVFVFQAHPVPGLPMVMDPSGLWCRPEGDRYLCGKAPAPDQDPDGADLAVDHAQFDELWPLLAHRIPAFERLRVTGAWAGYYEYNTFDRNAVLGRVPGADNLLVIAGFSGHGMQHAPAAGRGIAELIVHGRYTTLDLTALGYARLLDGRPLVESNVY